MKRTNWCYFLSILLLQFGCREVSEAPITAAYVQIDSLLKVKSKANEFHGTVLIAQKDSITYNRHFGLASRKWLISIDENTRFDIASLNKSFIAVLIMIAVEEGKLKINDSLKKRLEELGYKNNFDEAITLHQMLCHTSGLPDYGDLPTSFTKHNFRTFKRLHFTNEGYVRFIDQIDAIAKPGERFYYSNFAYHLLCILLEEIYNQPFSQLLQAKITTPLGMKNTIASADNKEPLPHVATAYEYLEEEEKWLENDFIDLTLGRRIFSTTQDLYKWGKAMYNNSLLSQESMKLVRKNHLENITQSVAYGYGWAIHDGRQEYRFGNLQINKPYIIHGGETGGYKSMLAIINKGEYTISLLSNTGTRFDEMSLIQDIVHPLINKKE